jgi:AAA domain
MKDEIVRTTSYQLVESGILWLITEKREKLGLVFGEPGYGKTSAILDLCREHKGIYIEAIKGASPCFLANSILKAGTGQKVSSFAGSLETLIDYLRQSKRILFIDEAERIVDRADLIETIRTLHDQGGVPVILVGMTGIAARIQARPLFFDRFRYMAQVPPATLEDVGLIAGLSEAVEIEIDLLQAIYRDIRVARNCRRIAWAVGEIEKFAQLKRLKTIGVKEWGDRPFIPEFSGVNNLIAMAR